MAECRWKKTFCLRLARETLQKSVWLDGLGSKLPNLVGLSAQIKRFCSTQKYYVVTCNVLGCINLIFKSSKATNIWPILNTAIRGYFQEKFAQHLNRCNLVTLRVTQKCGFSKSFFWTAKHFSFWLGSLMVYANTK